MTVSFNMGIEGISYRSYAVDQEGDFPRSKVYLPLSASIPSHLDDVLDLFAHDRFVTAALAPRIANRDVTVPCNYGRLFHEIRALGAGVQPANERERQVVDATMALFSVMKGDFDNLSMGREALIRG